MAVEKQSTEYLILQIAGQDTWRSMGSAHGRNPEQALRSWIESLPGSEEEGSPTYAVVPRRNWSELETVIALERKVSISSVRGSSSEPEVSSPDDGPVEETAEQPAF